MTIDGDVSGSLRWRPKAADETRFAVGNSSRGLTSGFQALENARSELGVDKNSASLLSTNAFRSEEPLYLEGFAWRAADDLDIQVKPEDEMYKSLTNVIQRKRWTSKSQANMWFATDTEVLYDSPDGPLRPKKVEKKTEICNNYQDDDDDGKPDCLDSDCKDDKFCKSRKACPSVSRVLRLAKMR